ncbi:MAG: NAD(P)-dependent oxidoreductase [Novosphingobium sp.]|nr:NAD(P)-dependent oxidoreductase [Novosphingobium sp.]
MLKDKKILVTGVTGMAPMPVAEFLAQHNEVWGVSRFTDAGARRRLEAKGITTRAIDLADGDLSALPQDFTHLLLCAHTRLGPGEFDRAIEVNGVSAGRVMQHCARAEAAVVFSSGSIYSINDKDGYYPFKETDDIGRTFPPWAPTSPISKASLEAVARFCAKGFNIPTTIVRLNIVYGPVYGMPFMDAAAVVNEQAIRSFADPYPANVIHRDDMCDQIEAMFDAASVPALTVNWCGDDIATRHGWIERAAQLSGKPAQVEFVPTPGTPPGSVLDATLRRSITGPCKVRFRDAFDAIYKQQYGQ